MADVLILTVVLVGLLLTYTQLRARRERITTDQLVQALRRNTGADSAGQPPVGA